MEVVQGCLEVDVRAEIGLADKRIETLCNSHPDDPPSTGSLCKG